MTKLDKFISDNFVLCLDGVHIDYFRRSITSLTLPMACITTRIDDANNNWLIYLEEIS